MQKPALCPICGSKYIKYFGVGTQKVEEETKKNFPAETVLRMDMDTTSGKHGHEKMLDVFRRGGASILIGTQMIAKGLDFPNVTLVGVVAADVSLNNGDFRSGETTFQLLTQVAGRAGRAHTPGKVFIQTYNPDHYSIVFAKAQNYEAFYRHEIALRRQMVYPPFSFIFSVLFSGASEKQIIILLHKLAEILKADAFELLGPAPAQIFKIKNRYRWKLLIKGLAENSLKNHVVNGVRQLNNQNDMTGVTQQLTLDPVMIE
jgi:primosomal protein N' (replication factor Y)